ncbi:MAG: hypothetical protein WAN86_05565 [Hyphomicrobiaceae bacterium]
MKRILIAGAAAVALGTSVVLAASPQVDGAIKTIQAAGADPAKMTAFCGLIDMQGDDEDKAGAAAVEKEDPALEKQEDTFLAQLGPAFEAAWDVGEELDENSADGKEYGAAVDAVAEKCP